MPSQQIPAVPVGGITSRRHAKLLLHLVEGGDGGGASVKDLRLRRVVPPASATLDASPECAAAAKPGSVQIQSTPPEPAAAAAAEDRERKPVLPRSKLVRDPASFGYRRLLPFLNQMANKGSDISSVKDMPSENKVSIPNKELSRSDSGLADERPPVEGSQGGPAPVDSVEPPPVAKAGADSEICDSVKEEIKVAPVDLASTKPALARCTRSKFVHHPSSFSYKRMLPFLMENETSSKKEDIAKFQTVSEEKQLTSHENDVLASGNHLSVSEGSPEACYQAELDRIVEEISSTSDDSYLLKGVQLQSAVAVAEAFLDGSTSEVQKVTQEVLASDGDQLCPDKGELTSERNDVLAGGHRQLAVSDGSAKESNSAEAEMIVEEKATKSDENSVLNGRDIQSVASEVSPQYGDTDEMKEVTEKSALTSDGDESSGLTPDKGEFLMKDQPQLCDSKKLLQANAELAEVQQCQSPGCLNAGLGSPTNAVTVDGGADPHGAPERQDFVASPGGLLLDVGMICKPSEPSIHSPLSTEGMPGCVKHAESGSSKVGTLHPWGSPCLEQQGPSPKRPSPTNGAFSGISFLNKRGFSPKTLSPKKGILKRNTMGCKGICMCLDCSVFRLRADRAFEFSRKQMKEADDIIVNLLEEVASLRSLAEKSSGQQEQMEACQRALRVEEVAKERRQQMLAELNSHCKIPGPRVKFAQYVDEKMASSPSSSSCRKQPHS